MESTARGMQVTINDGLPITSAEVSVEYEQIEVTSLTKPDLGWEFIDANGHFHAYTADGKLPTVRYREEYVRVESSGDEDEDDYEDGYSITHVECAICGEEIRPGVTSSTFREFAQGRMFWSLTIGGFVAPGERVSVRIVNGDQLLFGIAEAVEATATSNAIPVTKLQGIGVLGSRKARNPATSAL